MSSLKNIIVTGSNKGIGLGIADYLARQNSWNVILAVRNVELGQKALQQLRQKYPQASIQLERLDVSDSKSIEQFVETIKQKYNEIHVLVNNAGVLDRSENIDSKIVKWTFQTVNPILFRISTAQLSSPKRSFLCLLSEEKSCHWVQALENPPSMP